MGKDEYGGKIPSGWGNQMLRRSHYVNNMYPINPSEPLSDPEKDMDPNVQKILESTKPLSDKEIKEQLEDILDKDNKGEDQK